MKRRIYCQRQVSLQIFLFQKTQKINCITLYEILAVKSTLIVKFLYYKMKFLLVLWLAQTAKISKTFVDFEKLATNSGTE